MYARKPRSTKRRAPRRKARRSVKKSPLRTAAVNTASLRETYQISATDGTINFIRNIRLANAVYDRAQQVARAYQEFKIKYVKMTFRPSADTFPIAAGNVMPSFYYQIDRAGAIPTNANLQTLLDMGCKPVRFDDKNIVRVFRPAVLLAADTTGVTTNAGVMKVTPWLSTNDFAADPTGAWAPSDIDHGGCAFLVSKINALTPAVNFLVEVEVVFCFRKPLWRAGTGDSNTVTWTGDVAVNSQSPPLIAA